MKEMLSRILEGSGGKIALSLVAVVFFALVAYFIIRLINRRVEDFNTRHKSRKAITTHIS